MVFRLYVVIDKENQTIEQAVKDSLKNIQSSFSFSPSRQQASLNGCLEFYATGNASEDEIQKMLDVLNNDWDGDDSECSAYGFNTKMFHPNVYYLQFEKI